MEKGRQKAELVLSEDKRVQLQSMVRSRSLPAALCQRAKIVLACAADEANAVVARHMGTTNATGTSRTERRYCPARRLERPSSDGLPWTAMFMHLSRHDAAGSPFDAASKAAP